MSTFISRSDLLSVRAYIGEVGLLLVASLFLLLSCYLCYSYLVISCCVRATILSTCQSYMKYLRMYVYERTVSTYNKKYSPTRHAIYNTLVHRNTFDKVYNYVWFKMNNLQWRKFDVILNIVTSSGCHY